jgi:hypothetical protein
MVTKGNETTILLMGRKMGARKSDVGDSIW